MGETQIDGWKPRGSGHLYCGWKPPLRAPCGRAGTARAPGPTPFGCIGGTQCGGDEREARVYPGVRRVRGSRRCARAPPTAASDYWGACDHGAGGHPGWARPQRAGPVVPGFTLPGPAARARRRRRHQAEDLDALLSAHLHARHAGSPGPGIGVRLLAEAGSDQRQSAALVARTAQLRARSASLPRGAQGAGQPEVRARPPDSRCRLLGCL